MKLSSESIAEILRLSQNEKWPVGTIARHFSVHYSTISRILTKENEIIKTKNPGVLSEFQTFILDTLEKYPDICATRIYGMIKERGYKGQSVQHVRRQINIFRPKKRQEAFLKLSTLPGEQGQMDWADFGRIKVGNTEHKLMAFVFVLSYSRAIYFRFFYNCRMPFFQQGFCEAFDFFEGAPRVVLCDNLKSGVTQRIGKIIQYNSDFLELCKHYKFEPQAVGVRKGNEKGKVERAIRFIRDNFFEGRSYKNIEDLNFQALSWCLENSLERALSRGDKTTVGEVLEKERPFLLTLPNTPFICWQRVSVQVPKVPFARFETNDYSVPPQFNRRTLELIATDSTLEFISGVEIVAKHLRCWEKHKTIEIPEHHAQLRAEKKTSEKHAGLAKLKANDVRAEEFIQALAERGEHIGGAVNSLLKMLDLHGAKLFSLVLTEVLSSSFVSLKNMHHIFRKLNEQQTESLPIAPLKLDPKFALISVKPHDLLKYDNIANGVKNE